MCCVFGFDLKKTWFRGVLTSLVTGLVTHKLYMDFLLCLNCVLSKSGLNVDIE